MKKLVLTLCVVGSSLALAACGTTNGDTNMTDDQAPYADERTVGNQQAESARARPAAAERTFSSAQNK